MNKKEFIDEVEIIIDNWDSLVESVKGKTPEHCILPEHYKGIVRDIKPNLDQLINSVKEDCANYIIKDLQIRVDLHKAIEIPIEISEIEEAIENAKAIRVKEKNNETDRFITKSY